MAERMRLNSKQQGRRKALLKMGAGLMTSQLLCNQTARAMNELNSMDHPAAAHVCDATVAFNPQTLITPLQLSTGTISEITEAKVSVAVELAGEKGRGKGQGSIYLSDLWAWPDNSLGHARCDKILRGLCEQIASDICLGISQEFHHPLEIGLRLHDWVCHDLSVPEDPPPLARAMCASPFDAAIHDAVGNALNCSAFKLFEQTIAIPSADRYFPSGGAIRAVANLLKKPKTELPAWLIVNKSDDLATTVVSAIRDHGYRCFKLKITGRDVDADAKRTSEVFQAVKNIGVVSPQLSVDSNEANPDAASVAEFLALLTTIDPDAYKALQYLEQPTGRDISEHSFEWHKVAAEKPVMLDEGLTDLSVLAEAEAQGWSGLALKTCKGHSMLLAAAAWGHQHNMLLSLQDLTNPGISLIHAALVGAHLPTINGAELNSPQFTPAANEPFLPRLSSLFVPTQGVHQLPTKIPVGLGASL